MSNRQIDKMERQSASSYQRINLVTEAQSVLPSIASAFSYEGICMPQTPQQPRNSRLAVLRDQEAVLSSSCKERLDVYEDPDYTDTIQSNDSANSLLRRSVSVPSDYIYPKHKHRLHVREVFEDFLAPAQVGKKQPEDDPLQQQGRIVWRQTMEDLLEKSDYIDSLDSTSSGTLLLAKTARIIASSNGKFATDLMPWKEEKEEELNFDKQKSEGKVYWKNLFVLSLSFMLAFTAYMPLRNLQSSLYHMDGLGTYALSAIYASLFLGCVSSTTIVQRLRPKNTIVLGFLSILVYTAANGYPQFYTLIPASSLLGFTMANIWTAHATYLTNLAASYAALRGKDLGNVLMKFNGMFFLLFQVAQILGGIISSTVLMSQPVHHDDDLAANYTLPSHVLNYYGNQNLTRNLSITPPTVPITADADTSDIGSICGANYCHVDAVDKFSVDIEPKVIYILLGIFGGCVVTGLLLMVIFLDPLEGEMKKSHKHIGEQLLAVFKFFFDRRVVCLLGLMFYSTSQVSFMFGSFTKAFVTCPVGIHMVGYIMLCVSAFSGVSAYVTGRVQKHAGRPMLMCIAGTMHFILLVVMLLWKPNESTILVLLLIGGAWGIADGIFLTQIISMIGVLFQDKKEPAFAGLKMCQSSAVCIGFIIGDYFCMSVKIYLLLALLSVGMAGYISMEVMLRRQANREVIDTQKVTQV